MESRNNWKGWLYLAPVLILMIIFTFYPLINTFIVSFRETYAISAEHGYVAEGWTLSNYGKVLKLIPIEVKEIPVFGEIQLHKTWEETFVKYALPNTLILTFITVPISILIALLIAVGLNSIKKLQKIFQTIFFMPYVTNTIAVGMVFSVIFASGENGLWNSIFGLGEKAWVDLQATKDSAMIVLCIYIVWNALPYKILILLSGLQNIDKQYYQAAQIDSAGKIKTFWRVTVPLLSPQIFYIMITSFIGAFKEYNSVVGVISADASLGTEQKPVMSTIVFYINNNIKSNVTYASAAAVVLFVIIMLFTAIQFAVGKKRVHY